MEKSFGDNNADMSISLCMSEYDQGHPAGSVSDPSLSLPDSFFDNNDLALAEEDLGERDIYNIFVKYILTIIFIVFTKTELLTLQKNYNEALFTIKSQKYENGE